jgi:dihydroorotate dehydrogenase electron transfer subunit
MIQETATLTAQQALGGGYLLMSLHAPRVAALARPGQFVHAQIPGLGAAALRRPLSIFDVEDGSLRIAYKRVGRGTEMLSTLAPGSRVNLVGPLGNGFPMPSEGAVPVLVAGGYGVAPLHFFARKISTPGHVFIGGRTAADILFAETFAKLSWTVHTATEDGSLGTRGRVTDALLPWVANRAPGVAAENPALLEAFACGPGAMMRALASQLSIPLWVSLDRHMVCGVGACWACVQKIKMSDGSVAQLRVCHDGPVFNAKDVQW